MAVLLFHADLGVSGGFVGVDVFFVISGFLISSLILKDLQTGTFSLGQFWERRIRRIFPALLVTVTAVLIAGWFFYFPDDYWALAKSALAQASLISNYHFRQQIGYFAPAADTKPLLHTWSLAVEEQFYLLFPLLLLVLFRNKRVKPLKVLLFLLCVFFGWSVFETYKHPSSAFYLLPSRAWELLIGAVIATSDGSISMSRWLREATGFLGAGMVVMAMIGYDSHTRFPGLGAAAPCIGTALLIISSQGKPSLVGRAFSWRPIVFVGLISYSLYLWHWPILVYAKYLQPTGLSVANRAFLLIGSVVIAIASWKYVETPFRKRAICRDRRQVFVVFAIGTVALLVAGFVILRASGFESRFPERVLAYLDYSVTRNGRKPLDLQRVFKVEVDAKAAAAGNFPVMGTATTNGRFEIAVWGDSHAGSLVPVIDQLCKKYNVHGIEAIRSSTFPSANFRESTADADEAEKFNTAVLNFISRNKIGDVIIAARWIGYTDSDLRRKSLLSTIDELRNCGCIVYVVRDVPGQPFDVPRAAATMALRGRDINALCISTAAHEKANGKFEDWFQQMDRHGVVVLDPAPYFEENGQCVVLRRNELLYADPHHLTIEGARELTPLFEPIFQAHRRIEH